MASWPPAWLTPVKPESIARGDGDDAIEFVLLLTKRLFQFQVELIN